MAFQAAAFHHQPSVVWCGVRKENRPTASRAILKKLKGGGRCLHFFCRSDPKYKLPAATLRRLSHPVSQTGPSVVVGPTVPAQQKN